MNSLKAELRGETTPQFQLMLPVGWVRREPTDQVRDELLGQAKARLMAVHRPDLYAQTLAMTNRMFRDMQRLETVAFFGPAPDAPAEAFLPASLTAAIRRGDNGASLDDDIAALIRDRGATSLGGDKRFVRWEQRRTEQFEGSPVSTTTVLYIIPVPGSGRRRALQFTLVIPHGEETPEDEAMAEGIKTMFDAHLSTFSWVAA